MSTIKALYDRVKAMDTDSIIRKSIEAITEQMADKNAAQMFTGLRSDGTEITPTYKDTTIMIKKKKGQPSDRVTLRDTGSFYRGIKVTVEGDIIETDSSDEKAEKLKEKYGENIFGLGGEFKTDSINEDLRPVFKNNIEEATGLTMK